MDINFNELLKVKPKKEKPTFLNVISCDYREVYISSLIGYALLNDDELAKNLLELYFKKFPQKLKRNDYLNFDLSQIDIELEKSMDGRRADVFVKINDIDNPNIPISTITIENKTDSSEHGNQTLDYYNWINNEYKETNNAFFYLELQIKERTAFEYCGFKIILPANMAKGKPFVWLEREGKYYVELGDTEVGVLIRIDNYLNNLDKHIENQQKQLFNMGERKKGIQKELGNDENYADVIAELKEKLAEIDDKLGVNKK